MRHSISKPRELNFAKDKIPNTHETYLESLGNIMCNFQRRLLIQQDINFNPNTVTSMIGLDRFIAIDQRREAPGEISKFLQDPIVDRGPSEAEDIFETGRCPLAKMSVRAGENMKRGGGHYIVNDEKREESSSEGIKPPDIGSMTHSWED